MLHTTHPAIDALGPIAALDPSALAPYMAAAQARVQLVEDADGIPLYTVEGEGVAVIRVEGPLARRALAWPGVVYFDGYDRIANALLAADADPTVRARLMVIDSPGGAAAGLFDMTRRVLEAPARTPLVTFAEGRAASAGMALFALGDESYLSAEDSVGSIGTIMVHTDISRALENAGVKMTAIVDPVGKANAWSYWPLSDEAKAVLQEDVSALSSTFYDYIAARRGITAEAVKVLNARMLMGKKAVDAGLANGVASHSQAFARAETLGREKEKTRVKNVYALLGLAATASVEDADKAAASAAPMLELGRAALTATGEADPVAAKGALESMRRDALETPKLRADLAALATKTDQEERNALLVALAKVEPPALVWEGGDKTKGPVQELATMATPALRAYVKRRADAPPRLEQKVLTGNNETAANTEPSAAEIKAYMTKHGIKNPDIAKHAIMNARAAESAA